MPAVVVDASALVELLLQSPRQARVRQAVSGADMVAPDLINVEVLSTLRRLERLGTVTSVRASQAVEDLGVAPLRCWSTLTLLDIVWRLRFNVSAYDACYIALARSLRCALVTSDARLSRMPGLGVPVILV